MVWSRSIQTFRTLTQQWDMMGHPRAFCERGQGSRGNTPITVPLSYSVPILMLCPAHPLHQPDLISGHGISANFVGVLFCCWRNAVSTLVSATQARGMWAQTASRFCSILLLNAAGCGSLNTSVFEIQRSDRWVQHFLDQKAITCNSHSCHNLLGPFNYATLF